MKQLAQKSSWEGEKIKGSRFIVNFSPVFSSEEAKIFLEEVRELYPDARHHCFAYRLSSGEERSSDSGEPRGSSGPPILQRLQSNDIIDAMVIVTRYFGGVKLGVGGLIRAYGGAAGQALKTAKFKEIEQGVLLKLIVPYSQDAVLRSIIKKYTASIQEERYGEDIRIHLLLEERKASLCKEELIERSSNRIKISEQR